VHELEAVGDPTAFFKREAPDAVIWLPPGNRALARGAKNAGVPLRIGTSHKWFHWLDCNQLVHFSRYHSSLHEAQANFRLLEPFGLKEIPGIAELSRLAALQPDPHAVARMNFEDGRFNLLIHPKSNGNGREWPLEHFARLAQLLASRTDIRLWITGSQAEGELLQRAAPGLLAQANVQLLCGSCDLAGLMKLMAQSQGLIASGTGPLHLAAALGVPALGLFPPRRPIHPQRWQPLGARAEYLCLPQECSKPCQDASDCACMAALTPEMVSQRVLQWHAAWQRALASETPGSPAELLSA
jgi:ADP-heptose:LPS heptosyltransferase